MRRGDGIFVGTGAWGLAGALVELVGGLVGLSSCFSLPVVASFAPGGGRLWVPRWSAGRPNHDGPSAAIGCTGAISFASATSSRVIGRQPRQAWLPPLGYRAAYHQPKPVAGGPPKMPDSRRGSSAPSSGSASSSARSVCVFVFQLLLSS